MATSAPAATCVAGTEVKQSDNQGTACDWSRIKYNTLKARTLNHTHTHTHTIYIYYDTTHVSRRHLQDTAACESVECLLCFPLCDTLAEDTKPKYNEYKEYWPRRLYDMTGQCKWVSALVVKELVVGARVCECVCVCAHPKATHSAPHSAS